MAVGAVDFGAEMAEEHAPDGDEPRDIDPDDTVGGVEESVGPAQHGAFGDPGGLGGDGMDAGELVLEGVFEAGGGVPADEVELVDGRVEKGAKTVGEGCLAAALAAQDVDAAHAR